MSEREEAFTPAWRWREMIAAKDVSPVEVTEFYLRRIEALNPQLNAYLTVAADHALADAKAAEDAVAQSADLGPLHGVPYGREGLDGDGRHPHDQRLAVLQGLRAGEGRADGGAAPQRGGGDSRQDEHARVRPFGNHGEYARRAMPQPVGHGALAWGV